MNTVIGTAANVINAIQGHRLLHCKETVVLADACFQYAANWAQATVLYWHVPMRLDKRKQQKSWGVHVLT